MKKTAILGLLSLMVLGQAFSQTKQNIKNSKKDNPESTAVKSGKISRVLSMFTATDSNDADKFVAHLTPDVTYHSANAKTLVCREAVKNQVLDFWPKMDGVIHHILNTFEVGDTVIVQFDMEYRRKDGTVVHIPCCDVLTFRGDLVSDFRIYIDIAPLYAK
jgi:ketosteroid isomerase-like protein